MRDLVIALTTLTTLTKVLGLIKRCEQIFTIFLRNTDACVSHLYADTEVCLRLANDKLLYRYIDQASFFRKFNCIVDQVYHDLLNSNFVNPDNLICCVFQT